jgi:hypothetical protein
MSRICILYFDTSCTIQDSGILRDFRPRDEGAQEGLSDLSGFLQMIYTLPLQSSSGSLAFISMSATLSC